MRPQGSKWFGCFKLYVTEKTRKPLFLGRLRQNIVAKKQRERLPFKPRVFLQPSSAAVAQQSAARDGLLLLVPHPDQEHLRSLAAAAAKAVSPLFPCRVQYEVQGPQQQRESPGCVGVWGPTAR